MTTHAPATNKRQVSFIGFGHMAKAIARGLSNHPGYQLSAAAPSLPIGKNQAQIMTHYDNRAIAATADVIILAVKPSQIPQVYAEIQTIIPKSCLIISVATGISLSWFANNHSQPLACIRAMPNLGATIQQSATPLIANTVANKHHKQIAFDIFSSIGFAMWVDSEDDIDRLTAISGSGPAYVFLFIESLIKAAKTLGLSENIAQIFSLQTVQAAVNLACSSNSTLEELRHQVTSPGGTTAAAIDIFLNHGFDDLIALATKAAYHRAQELGLK